MSALGAQLRPSNARADTAITTVAAMITPWQGQTEPEVGRGLGFDPRSRALVNLVPEHVGHLHWHHTCSKRDTALPRHANSEEQLGVGGSSSRQLATRMGRLHSL